MNVRPGETMDPDQHAAEEPNRDRNHRCRPEPSKSSAGITIGSPSMTNAAVVTSMIAIETMNQVTLNDFLLVAARSSSSWRVRRALDLFDLGAARCAAMIGERGAVREAAGRANDLLGRLLGHGEERE